MSLLAKSIGCEIFSFYFRGRGSSKVQLRKVKNGCYNVSFVLAQVSIPANDGF